jgi:cardiolipin synthase
VTAAVVAIAELVRHLPSQAVDALMEAVTEGAEGLRRLRARAAASPVREACDRLSEYLVDGVDSLYLAGALAAAQHLESDALASSVQIVWTGPDSGDARTRLTLAAVTDLIASARRELLLVSYAAHSDPRLNAALEQAAARGVEITLLLERTKDNPAYESWAIPFHDLTATRLVWLQEERPAGATLHAKILVVDDDVVLVGSANLTTRAMETNLECGVLIRGHGAAIAVADHLLSLRHRGILRPLPRT